MVEIKGVHNNSGKNSSKFSLMWLIPHTAQFVQALVHVVETHLEAGQPLSRVVCVLKFTKKEVELRIKWYKTSGCIKITHNKFSKLSMMWLIPHTAQFVQALAHVVETHLEAGQSLPRVGLSPSSPRSKLS